MRLLILGAAGPYTERLTAFVTQGHKVWYVGTEWMPADASWFHDFTVHKLDELGGTMNEAVEAIVNLIVRESIDVVYSLLNVWDNSNSVTATLLNYGCPVPVVRHYKEHYFSPSEEEKTVLEKSTGVVFINQESRDYFASLYQLPQLTACIDADLIPVRYLTGKFQTKLSSQDHTPHFLIAGSASEDGGRYDYRELINELTDAGAHVHLYLQFRKLTASGQLNNIMDAELSYRQLKNTHLLHFHAAIQPENFVEEWSRYDAGLLHVPRPNDPFRSLNIPNRYSAYLAAGVPVALQAGTMTAMQRQLEKLGTGIIYNNITELIARLPDPNLSERTKAIRNKVTFEAVFPELMAFIHQCKFKTA